MSADEVRRIVVPLAIAAGILLSARGLKGPEAVELPGGLPPAGPSAAEVRAAWAAALAPGAPGYDEGRAGAPVVVVEFSDFGCGYCARFAAETFPRLSAEYVRTGRVRWRFVPFSLGMFPNGGAAARAAVCAAEQGGEALDAMRDLLFARRGEWMNAPDPWGTFRAYAGAARLDGARFEACYSGDGAAARVRAANDLAERLGVRATPTFFVDGESVEGALPVERFREVIRDAMGTMR